MSNSLEFEVAQPSLSKLALRLFVAMVCGMLPPYGFLYTMFSQGFVIFGGGGGEMQPAEFAIGIVLTAIGPILLGVFLKPGWRGLFAGIMGAAWILIFLIDSLDRIPIPKLLPDSLNIEFMPYSLDFIPPLFPFNIGIVFGLLAGGTLLVVFTVSGSVTRPVEFVGLILGLLVGYVLEFFFLNLPRYWGGGGTGMFIPYVWVSTAFFPELLGGRAGWRGLWVWLAFVFASYAMLIALAMAFRITF